jgi:hypothetical protein
MLGAPLQTSPFIGKIQQFFLHLPKAQSLERQVYRYIVAEKVPKQFLDVSKLLCKINNTHKKTVVKTEKAV